MIWLVISAFVFFIGVMVWIAYDMSFRHETDREKR